MKSKSFFAKPKKRLILLCSLITAAVVLALIIFLKKDVTEQNKTVKTDTSEIPILNNERKDVKESLNSSIDSILYNFGIKKEWITTEKKSQKAEWFSKSVLIPKDVTSVEINLDISSYLSEAGLSLRVLEDILSKDITIYVNNPDSTKKLPAAIVQVTHSDKVIRETGVIAIILDKINEFTSEEIDKLVISKNEFSYVFPRNLDDIDIQHKLMQHKKDIIINLTLGDNDNYEADFNAAMDDKTIHEKVRSFNADFASVNKVLLTKTQQDVSLNQLQNKIIAELSKSNIRVITDTLLTYSHNEKGNISSFFATVIQKAYLNKKVIVVYPVNKSEFQNFYNTVLTYKKLGYKFLNLSEYFSYIEEEKKKTDEVKKKPVDKKDMPKKTDKDKKPVDKKDISKNKKDLEKKKK